ncbi:MAG TPA: glycosyltransferase family 2 protein [Candidatus Paenibacillus intestinavium]|nr:glycosyltransferase family 2 protein [Candidatus Paenibacillus intestinavium]
MTNNKKIIVIVPAYNESGHIKEVIREIRANVPVVVDIVIIDDGSVDDTSSRALAAGAFVIQLPYNLGIGGAMQTGYRYAAQQHYDYAVRIDGDGQHDPADISAMLQALLESDRDMFIGSRFLTKEGYQSTWMRKIGIFTLSKLVGLVTGEHVTDPTSGYNVCNKKMIHLFAKQYPTDYPEVESLIMMKQYGCRFAELAVKMKPRASGKSSISSWKSIYYMIKVVLAVLIMRTRKTQKPQRLERSF